MSVFSNNLRFLRKKGNYNQEEIAILFHKRANTIGNWENGRSEPNLAELTALGKFFNVSMEDLLHSDQENREMSRSSENPAGSMSELPDSYSPGDPLMSMAREAGGDAFWVILRELRSLNDKLDHLTTGLDSGAFNRNSDKSSH
jgi:transcriptional regulator with XRE-family HTH domain